MPPALTPGSRLGAYKVLSVLGAGGMGEVYRAGDPKLGREVAIKVLLSAVATNPERLSRFEREAKTLASLNHPNIAQIYGLEEGQIGPFLVMELVEGPTLADRIAKGAIPVDEALVIARQIADALGAAHEQNVIHRDLKPANVKVRSDGVVKVLDFGLAKIMEPVNLGGDASQSPTITSPAMMTSAGVILGTAAYMSPEQARGKPFDHRTDIWAFACVLYEMLTGRRAFGGETVTDALAAIIEREPDWNRLPSTTPTAVRRLLRRCLVKDPARRLHDIVDARLELDDGLAEPTRDEASAAGPRRASGRIAWALALATSVIVASAITWFAAQRERTTLTDGPASDAKVEPLTYDSGVTRMPAVSPDGRLLAYASDRAGNGNLDIWVQQMSGGTPLRLTDDPADDSTPDFSPDGSQIVFRSERNGGGIYIVPSLGGPARLIVPEGRGPRFSPDGSRVAYWSGQFRGSVIANRSSSVHVIALSGGTPSPVLPDFEVATDPVWAADSRSVIVAGLRERRSQSSETPDWWIARLDGQPPVKTGVFETALLRGADISPSRWTSDGVLFSFNGDLWKVMLSTAGQVSAPPRRLTLGVGPYVDPSTGPNGEIVFARLVTQRAVERASLTNPTEPALRLYADPGSTTGRASGTTDSSVIVVERVVGGAREIWTKNTRSGRQELVVRVPGGNQLNATVSSDGARIAYSQDSNVAGRSVVTGYVVETSGGVPRKVCEACGLHGFLADNQRVLVQTTDGHAIRLIDVRTGAARDVIVAGQDGTTSRPHASPDDRWLAFGITRGSVGKTFVARLASDRAIPADSAEPIDEPTTTGRPAGWSLDSRVLYLLLDTDGFRCVWGQRIDPGTGALVGQPFVVRHFHTTIGMSTTFGNANTAGGFLYEAADVTANLWKLTTPQTGQSGLAIKR